MEYTNRAKEAFENFKILKAAQEKEMPDLYLGVGTVKTKEDAIRYINAGADFIVAPTVNPEVGEIVNQHDGLWIPGCMTPTEIHLAQRARRSADKNIPGQCVGAGFYYCGIGCFQGAIIYAYRRC